MSGIVGIFHLDGQPADSSELDKMIDSLAHRGPDGSGLWIDGPVGMGHRMLWTTPESLHEKIPVINTQGDLVLTSDARIDNREELISALRLKDYPAYELTDSQLILWAYEKWGQDCPEKIIGDFAFAIWDKRNQMLFCARDPVGAKPFFYYKSTKSFIFASEIKAILCASDLPFQLNELRIAEHLIQFFEDKTLSFYEDIFRLSEANSITVSPEVCQTRVYWSLDPKREINFSSEEDYSEGFLEIFTEAVRCRLRSAYPIGSTLSGGLDSSSIACTARYLYNQGGGKKLHTFSAIFPSLPEEDLRRIDERRYIEAVTALGGFESHYVKADLLSPMADFDRALWLQDEPFLAPNLYMHWALYRAAQQAGVRVFLDGIDGDVTVSYGLEYLADLARTGRWKTLVSEANAISNKPNASIGPRRVIWEYGIMPLIPESVFHFWRTLHGDSQPVWYENTVINPNFAKEIKLEKRVRSLRPKGVNALSGARKKHWLSLNSALIPLGLELLEKATTEFTLEARYPFFDRRLMEFCLALPPDQKLSMGWTRIVMRRAMEGILPAEIQWRFTKANLSPNFMRNFYDFESRKLNETLLDQKNQKIIAPYVNLTALEEAYHRYVSHPLEDERETLLVYGVIILTLWLKQNNFSS